MDNYKLKIKDFRYAKKITQKQLAEKLGMSRSYLSDLENKKFDIKISTLIRIGQALGVCPHQLVNICTKCPENKPLFFKRHDGIMKCLKKWLTEQK